jgi:hypothetical protein
MKRNVTKIALITVLVVLFFSGCKDFWHPEGSNQNTRGDNPFIGTWYGIWEGGGNQSLILIFQESFYSWTLPDGGGWGFSGSYTYSGNFATLYGEIPGTAEIIGSELILTCDAYLSGPPVICRK